jgi:hypothetical protein
MPESNFPSSLDTDANDSLPKTISNTAALNSPNHAEMHGRSNDAIIEIEEKVGIGDTTPTSGAILIGTGTGASAWDTSPTFLGAVTVGVNDTGHDVKFFGAESGAFLLWDQAQDDLELWGNAKINLTNTTAGSSNFQINFKESYDIYADNTGTGSDNTRLWFGGPAEGDFYVGPRASDDRFNLIQLRGNTSILGSISKTSGSFDIPHPTKGGDWRLRHSFIEGPTCDNIYRGTVTISGSSATVDLDTVSNMTDGTWEALNTNVWSMVGSSGNAVTWSLSGKTLTISGPSGAVCNWMVIGERKDQAIIDSSLTDINGKLVTEYENAEIDADAGE